MNDAAPHYLLSSMPERPAVDETRMSARGLLATETRDRQGDILLVAGVDLQAHRRNPVAMIDHGTHFTLPVGVTRDPDSREYLVEIDPIRGEIWQTTFFAQKNDVAQQIFGLVAEDVIRANSIGFMPIEYDELPPDPERGLPHKPPGKKPYMLVTRAELVEVSWCGIPVNPDAVRSALSRERWVGKSLAPEIRRMLSPHLTRQRYWRTTAGKSEKTVPLAKLIEAKAVQAPHEYGCLMAVIPEPVAGQIVGWAKSRIDPKHVGTEGVEDAPHVTVKYGFRDSGPETLAKVKAMLAAVKPFTIRLGDFSKFDGKPEEGDPLFLEVESKELHALNAKVSRDFPCKDSHPEYRPHLTLAYIDAKAIGEYTPIARLPFQNIDVRIDCLEWGGADGKHEIIPLAPALASSVPSTKSLTPADLIPLTKKSDTPPTTKQPPEGRTMADIRKPYGAEHLEEMHKSLCNVMHKVNKGMDVLDNPEVKDHSDKVMAATKAMAQDTEAVHGDKYPNLDKLDHEESMKAMDGEEEGGDGEEETKSLDPEHPGEEIQADAPGNATAKERHDEDMIEGDKFSGSDDEEHKAVSALDGSAGGSLVGDGKKKPSTVEGGEWRDKEEKDKEEKALRRALSELREINDRNERRAYAQHVA